MKKPSLPSLSVVFPAFNDEKTLPGIIKKTFTLLPKITGNYEIIVVNDGSFDNTAKILIRLKKDNPALRVIHHKKNKGYGAALASGFKQAKKEFIFYTDSDGQYDVSELKKLVQALDKNTDIVTGFKLKRSDPWFRKVIGTLYNYGVRIIFDLHVLDVDCDFRLFRRDLVKNPHFTIHSGAFDVEFITLLKKKGARFKEIPVHHYPREYGQSQFFSLKRIARSLWDLIKLV